MGERHYSGLDHLLTVKKHFLMCLCWLITFRLGPALPFPLPFGFHADGPSWLIINFFFVTQCCPALYLCRSTRTPGSVLTTKIFAQKHTQLADL